MLPKDAEWELQDPKMFKHYFNDLEPYVEPEPLSKQRPETSFGVIHSGLLRLHDLQYLMSGTNLPQEWSTPSSVDLAQFFLILTNSLPVLFSRI